MERKTPLYDAHEALNGKIVPFAGYLLPVQYEGVMKEHLAVRTAAGLFDVSHMGEILFEGEGALLSLQHLLTNDMSGMADGRVRYSPMCNDRGGVVDDVLVYKLSDAKYLMVVNASNREKDYEWMKAHLPQGVTLNDISDSVAQIALQGPMAKDILSKVCEPSEIPQKYYSFRDKVTVAGFECLLSKTGYTGEDGFELYCKNEDATPLWYKLLEVGEPYGLVPCGLGARDTLRLEAAMPLYGHEMDDVITPLETGLSMFVKMGKADFIGKKALLEKGEATRTRVGLEMVGRGIAREQSKLFIGEREIGITTSGTHCPYIQKAVAMALVDKAYSEIGTEMEVEVRGRLIACKVIPLPFYKKA